MHFFSDFVLVFFLDRVCLLMFACVWIYVCYRETLGGRQGGSLVAHWRHFLILGPSLRELDNASIGKRIYRFNKISEKYKFLLISESAKGSNKEITTSSIKIEDSQK